MRFGCISCEHRERIAETGECRCTNRDSDLWGLKIGENDSCLDWEPTQKGAKQWEQEDRNPRCR